MNREKIINSRNLYRDCEINLSTHNVVSVLDKYAKFKWAEIEFKGVDYTYTNKQSHIRVHLKKIK